MARDPCVVALDELAEGLDPRAGLRAWSLLMTILGDSFAPRGGAARLGALQTVFDRIGVEAGALRTAASRLAQDGWLERERRGRAAFYRLAPGQRLELERATRRIYAAGPPVWTGRWQVVIAPDERAKRREARAARMARVGFGRLGANAYIRPVNADEDQLEAAFGDSSIFEAPHDTARLAPEAVAAAWPAAGAAAALYEGLMERFAPLAAALEAGAAPRPLDALAARTLLIHQWRRAALRDPALPAEALPPGWPGERSRAFTGRLFWRLAGPSEAWLDRCDGGPDGPLPPPGPDFARRFGGPEGRSA